jgi:hypothetical protein
LRQFLNQHSYVFVALAVAGLAGIFLRRLGGPLRWIALAIVLALLVGTAAWLRTGAGDVGSQTDLDRVLARGKPVALEFFSNF